MPTNDHEEKSAATDDQAPADGEIKDPTDTDHPAGDKHAAENVENEPAG